MICEHAAAGVRGGHEPRHPRMKLQMGEARSPLPLPRGNDATSFPIDGSPSEEMLILH